MNDLQRAAARARPALAVLSAEIGEPSPDTVQALTIIKQMLDDIEAGQHPLDRPDDWPQRDRWPDRPHWDRWRWAIKTLAVASGTTAHCCPKYEYMRVDTRQARSDALTVALLDVADVIELASVREPSGTIDSFLGLCAGRTTPALTIDDMNEIAAAGWAGSFAMTREELIAAVPVHERDGRPLYVILDDIPQPWRDQFWAALRGSQCPKVEGVERAAYAWDWQSWVRDLEDNKA